LGNNLGYYELAAFILYALWSLGTTLYALYQAGNLMDMLAVKEKGVKTEGNGGVMMDDLQAIKFFTLEMVIGFTSIVAGFALGDVADQLVAWWDSYSTKTWYEGQDKDTGKYDVDGTAAEYDYAYHWGVLGVSYVVFSAITVGGYWFANQFMVWSDPTEKLCKLDEVSSTVKNNVLSALG
jgi:hypothetical protein